MRVGGLDVLAHGLSRQTFKDFELVLSDGLFGRRREAVEEGMGREGIRVRHVEPRGNPFPLNSFCRYANEAIRGSCPDSEISVTITDYTWLPPDSLRKHVDFHASRGENEALACPHQYVTLPPVSERFGAYGREEVDRYAEDVSSGALDWAMWSIMREPFGQDPRALPVCPEQGGADPKLTTAAGYAKPNVFHGKNESVKTRHLLAVGGWNEELDGAHCYQDTELAERLSGREGVQWFVEPSNVAYIVNPRPIFPFPRRPDPISRNEAIWRRKASEGYPLPPPLR